MMPGTEVIIDTLFAVSDEGSQLFEVRVVGWGADNDDEGARIERKASLAAERVVFQMVDPSRHAERVTGHQPVNRDLLLTFHFYPRKFGMPTLPAI